MREVAMWRGPFYRICKKCKWVGWSIVIPLLLMAGGCATSPPSGSQSGVFVSGDNSRVSNALRTEIQSWIGTPHRMGGMSRRGVDCSGLVVVVYDELFGLRLPRTTADLIHAGERVNKKYLTSGDLIFFKPEYKSRHVGIYLGRGEFVHTSYSRGVMISRLDDGYWRQCYVTGRRVL